MFHVLHLIFMQYILDIWEFIIDSPYIQNDL